MMIAVCCCDVGRGLLGGLACGIPAGHAGLLMSPRVGHLDHRRARRLFAGDKVGPTDRRTEQEVCEEAHPCGGVMWDAHDHRYGRITVPRATVNHRQPNRRVGAQRTSCTLLGLRGKAGLRLAPPAWRPLTRCTVCPSPTLPHVGREEGEAPDQAGGRPAAVRGSRGRRGVGSGVLLCHDPRPLPQLKRSVHSLGGRAAAARDPPTSSGGCVCRASRHCLAAGLRSPLPLPREFGTADETENPARSIASTIAACLGCSEPGEIHARPFS